MGASVVPLTVISNGSSSSPLKQMTSPGCGSSVSPRHSGAAGAPVTASPLQPEVGEVPAEQPARTSAAATTATLIRIFNVHFSFIRRVCPDPEGTKGPL